LGSFQPDRLFSSVVAWVDHQKSGPIDTDRTQGEIQRSRVVVGLTVGPLDRASDLVVFESGLESHHIELESLLDQGSPLVIFPSAAADSAHFNPSFS
jgi:hypothetical protein